MEKNPGQKNKIYYLFIYFLIYSFIGWLAETIYVSVNTGRLVNRGFLYGPFCPIYGFGALLVVNLLKSLKKNRFAVFICSIVITSILEYATGALFKIFFDKKLWDYNDEFLNISGFVCLKNSLIWGAASCILIYIVHPRINCWVSHISKNQISVVSSILMICFAIDLILSFTNVMGLNSRINNKIAESPNINRPRNGYEELLGKNTGHLVSKLRSIKERFFRTINKKSIFSPKANYNISDAREKYLVNMRWLQKAYYVPRAYYV